MKRVGVVVLLVGLVTLSACNFNPGIPITPTLIPTLPSLPTELPLPRTAVLLPSATVTSTTTATVTLSPIETMTQIVPPTASATDTVTITDTLTLTPTVTFTVTATPQPTETLIPPTSILTEIPTDIPSTTAEPITATPIPTVTASITLVPIAAVITATSLPISTDVPGGNPTLVATASGPIDLGTPFNPTYHPSVTPGAQVMPVAPSTPPQTPSVSNAATPATIAALPTTLAIFAPNGVVGGQLEIPPTDTAGNAISDVDVSSKGSRAVIDASGHLTIDGSGYDGDGHKHARQIFKLARWSPDGNWLAYIVETPNAEANKLSEVTTNDDGVWIVQPGGNPIHVFLNVYQSGDAHFRVATGIAWSPENNALIITARIYPNDPDVQASFLVGLGRNVQDDMPLFADGGMTWLGANALVAVKSLGNPNVTLGIFNLTGQAVAAIGDGATLHFWMQDPARLSDGRYAFLGKPSITGRLENGPTQLSLYTLTPGSTTPIQVSTPVAGPILAAEWNPANTIILVIVQTDRGVRTEAITLDGAIIDVGPGGIHWKR